MIRVIIALLAGAGFILTLTPGALPSLVDRCGLSAWVAASKGVQVRAHLAPGNEPGEAGKSGKLGR